MRRHIEGQLAQLERYQKEHPEDHHDPTDLEPTVKTTQRVTNVGSTKTIGIFQDTGQIKTSTKRPHQFSQIETIWEKIDGVIILRRFTLQTEHIIHIGKDITKQLSSLTQKFTFKTSIQTGQEQTNVI